MHQREAQGIRHPGLRSSGARSTSTPSSRRWSGATVDFEQVYDVIAFRIVVDNITECYKALGVIHATYKPVPGRFKDYIAMPKANGYQSLHTTVIGPHGERVEIQIRTQDMHQVAEGGIAAHWKYKEGKFDSRSRENVEWVHRLLEWNKDLSDPNEFLETVKIDLFAEDVFVFTPKGEVRQLPHGATPLDFAYAVHTDVGNKCVGAKVNGKIVPLKHRLKSGDTVEVVTSPSQTPSKDWLKIVKSSRAKAKIRAVIKEQERARAHGARARDARQGAARHYGLNLGKLEKSGEVAQSRSEAQPALTVDELYIFLGYGRLDAEHVIPDFVPKEALERKIEARQGTKTRAFSRKFSPPPSKRSETAQRDHRRQSRRRADPLRPLLQSPSRRQHHRLHHARPRRHGSHRDLHQGASTTTRNAGWTSRGTLPDNKARIKRHVKIRVLSQDEPGLLALMSQTISACGVNISSANIRTTKDKKAIALFDVEVGDLGQLQKITSALESKKGVIMVERVRS